MCTECNKPEKILSFTEYDLKLEYRADTGCSVEEDPEAYAKWLERKVVDQRNFECNSEKCNNEIQKVLIDEFNEDE